jgi:pimeloyl-ACP methyl ester carboxylesterase
MENTDEYVTHETADIRVKAMTLPVRYFDRRGPGPIFLFVHGLGNSCSNFEELCAQSVLSQHRLIAMDLPGCGGTMYPADTNLNIDDLVDFVDEFVQHLQLPRFLLVGASMGGLIALLYAERHPERVTAFVNVEGNLAPEDCMFSRLVIPHDFSHFQAVVFPAIKAAVAGRDGVGFAKHLHVLLRADLRAYYDYSFQTVEYSDHGHLLERFLKLPVRRHFVYGSVNRGLSYLPRLYASTCQMAEIAGADHFLFYDDPAAFARALAEFTDHPGRIP